VAQPVTRRREGGGLSGLLSALISAITIELDNEFAHLRSGRRIRRLPWAKSLRRCQSCPRGRSRQSGAPVSGRRCGEGDLGQGLPDRCGTLARPFRPRQGQPPARLLQAVAAHRSGTSSRLASGCGPLRTAGGHADATARVPTRCRPTC